MTETDLTSRYPLFCKPDEFPHRCRYLDHSGHIMLTEFGHYFVNAFRSGFRPLVLAELARLWVVWCQARNNTRRRCRPSMLVSSKNG